MLFATTTLICQTKISNGSNTVLTVFQNSDFCNLYHLLEAVISDFDEHPNILMIECRASAGHGAGKIVGKDGSGDQPEGIFVIRNLSRKGDNQWPETAIDRAWVFYVS